MEDVAFSTAVNTDELLVGTDFFQADSAVSTFIVGDQSDFWNLLLLLKVSLNFRFHSDLLECSEVIVVVDALFGLCFVIFKSIVLVQPSVFVDTSKENAYR